MLLIIVLGLLVLKILVLVLILLWLLVLLPAMVGQPRRASLPTGYTLVTSLSSPSPRRRKDNLVTRQAAVTSRRVPLLLEEQEQQEQSTLSPAPLVGARQRGALPRSSQDETVVKVRRMYSYVLSKYPSTIIRLF